MAKLKVAFNDEYECIAQFFQHTFCLSDSLKRTTANLNKSLETSTLHKKIKQRIRKGITSQDLKWWSYEKFMLTCCRKFVKEDRYRLLHWFLSRVSHMNRVTIPQLRDAIKRIKEFFVEDNKRLEQVITKLILDGNETTLDVDFILNTLEYQEGLLTSSDLSYLDRVLKVAQLQSSDCSCPRSEISNSTDDVISNGAGSSENCQTDLAQVILSELREMKQDVSSQLENLKSEVQSIRSILDQAHSCQTNPQVEVSKDCEFPLPNSQPSISTEMNSSLEQRMKNMSLWRNNSTKPVRKLYTNNLQREVLLARRRKLKSLAESRSFQNGDDLDKSSAPSEKAESIKTSRKKNKKKKKKKGSDTHSSSIASEQPLCSCPDDKKPDLLSTLGSRLETSPLVSDSFTVTTNGPTKRTRILMQQNPHAWNMADIFRSDENKASTSDKPVKTIELERNIKQILSGVVSHFSDLIESCMAEECCAKDVFEKILPPIATKLSQELELKKVEQAMAVIGLYVHYHYDIRELSWTEFMNCLPKIKLYAD